jgi:hypothetical protein
MAAYVSIIVRFLDPYMLKKYKLIARLYLGNYVGMWGQSAGKSATDVFTCVMSKVGLNPNTELF